MIASPQLAQKKILLVDRERKIRNDRTWCFWETENGFFESLVHKKWDQLSFYGASMQHELDIAPYQYKMIRGIDFYNHCLKKIEAHANIDQVVGEVKSFLIAPDEITIHFDDRSLSCSASAVFNSFYKPSDPSHGELHLLQHLKGWIAQTPGMRFNADKAILMDFRVTQENGTSFMYFIPITPQKALVEFTVFSPRTLADRQYEIELRNYMTQFLNIDHFDILEEEFGIIPMTNATFPFYHNGVYNIGTAGGQIKASTGYTFQFVQKQSSQIINCLETGNSLESLSFTPNRFRFYDSVLLQLLVSKNLEGREIFTRLFARNKASTVFKFLDNETSLQEELRLISTLQTLPFLKAAWQLWRAKR